MSYTKVRLDCPECSHVWDEHLPILDKLTNIMLVAADLHRSIINGMPAEGYFLTKLGQALSKLEEE